METSPVIITTADIKDAELLTSLSVATFCETFMADNKKEDMDKYIAEEMSLEALTNELKDKENIFFLAAYNGTTVGYAKMRAIKKPEGLNSNNPIELERIYVLKEYLDKRIGSALMTHCIAYAHNGKHDTLWLGVWEHNYRAVNFYKRWGFELFGSHIFRLGDDDQTDVLMKKQL
ncbi:MAG: family N-acetyltransferase [Flavipsychrobacter sp.]|nr:family N-acetyltransferase [Flavipsychrobacter sp.]